MDNKLSQLLIDTLVSYGMPHIVAIACAKEFYGKLTAEFGVSNKIDGSNFLEQLEQLEQYIEDTKDSSTALSKVADRENITQLLMALYSTPLTYDRNRRYLASGCTSQEYIKYCTVARNSPVPVDGLEVFWQARRDRAKHLTREILSYLLDLMTMSKMTEPQRSEYLLDCTYHTILGVTCALKFAGKSVREVIDEYPEHTVDLYPFLSFYDVPTLSAKCWDIISTLPKKQRIILEYNNIVADMLKDFLKLPA